MDTEPVQEETSRAPVSRQSGALSLDVELGAAHFHAEGAGKLVLDAFEHFRAFYAEHGGTAAPASKDSQQQSAGTGAAAATPAAGVQGASEGGESIPLSVFLDSKKLPRGNAAVALGIAVWAKRHKKEEVVDADSVKAHWRISKRKVPSNIPRDLGAAASEGWLERLPNASGKYSVTGYGEKAFDELPAPDA